MLASLGDPILPIFAVLAAGFVLAKLGRMEFAHAQAINRFVFYIAGPALGISVIGRTSPGSIDWPVTAIYFGSELVVYAAVFAIMRFGFGRDRGEALILGMTAIFANHIFFVLPISERFFGSAAAAGMAGVVLLDIAVIFCGTALLAEVITSHTTGFSRTAALILRNPFVYAPPLGVVIGWLGASVPPGIWTFLDFTAAAAAPITLFSLGITLASSPLFPIRPPCWVVAAARVAVMPLLVGGGFHLLMGGLDTVPERVVMLVAAGPCGAMPFVIATQFGIRTVSVAKSVLLSTIFSLFSLSFLLPAG